MTTMRAKLAVTHIEKVTPDQDNLTFGAVSKSDAYPEDGSDENNTFARFTPMAELRMSVCNPALIGKFNLGDTFYVDFTPAE